MISTYVSKESEKSERVPFNNVSVCERQVMSVYLLIMAELVQLDNIEINQLILSKRRCKCTPHSKPKIRGRQGGRITMDTQKSCFPIIYLIGNNSKYKGISTPRILQLLNENNNNTRPFLFNNNHPRVCDIYRLSLIVLSF